MEAKQAKELIEDDVLQRLAAVLFAEVIGLVHEEENGYDSAALFPLIRSKTREFCEHIVQSRLTELVRAEAATEKRWASADWAQAMEERMSHLERVVCSLDTSGPARIG